MSKAFKINIGTYKSYKTSDSIEKSVHQASPSWVLTFVRWANRDTFRYTNIPGLNVLDKPLVVVNDCISVTVSQSKSSHTPTMTAIMRPGDINYNTALSPGDFVFVNMLEWQKYADEVANKAVNTQPINGEHDGFKGLFKIQSVRMVLMVDPELGSKRLMYYIQAYGMTELNNSIYFNDQVIPPEQQGKTNLFFERISASITSLITLKGGNNVQQILETLISLCLGSGPSELGKKDKGGNLVSPNSIFLVPSMVGNLLGVDAKVVLDIYRFLFGIQAYSGGSVAQMAQGLNPSNLTPKNGPFYKTSSPCTGSTMVRPDYWNQVTAWSLIQQYANLPVNEMYTCFKLNPDGKVMPTVVYRQIPFTSEQFAGQEVTKFLSLPRWHIDPALIYDFNVGRDEAARVNFVMVFGRNNIGQDTKYLMAAQIEQGNYRIDEEDIKRNGLRPWIITSNFDFPTASDKSITKAPYWAGLMADSIFGGHLKMNGTVKCAGIQDPIAPGDNFQLADTVYHIESVVHSASISPDGKKKFETTLELSHGVDVRSTQKKMVYAEMDHTDIQDSIIYDRTKENILPGISDTQFSYARGADGDAKAEKSNNVPSSSPTKKNIKNNQKQTAKNKSPKPYKGGRK